MSFDVCLKKDDEIVSVANHEEGGTYAVGGSTDADLNITYNYSWFYYDCFDKNAGLRWLNGKVAKDTIGRLERTVQELGTKQYTDYWAATPGNAGYALNILLNWAKEHPEATFEVC